jgi:hypothetical protein
VFIGKYQSDNSSIQNGLEQGYDLSPLLFTLVLGYAIRSVRENRERL